MNISRNRFDGTPTGYPFGDCEPFVRSDSFTDSNEERVTEGDRREKGMSGLSRNNHSKTDGLHRETVGW